MPAPSADSVPVITLDELVRRLGDDSTPPEMIRPYVLPVPSAGGGIAPDFQPNPSRVTGLERGLEGGFLVASLNASSRARRHRRYRDRIAAGWTGPRIVSEGDSWFQYPLFLEDIIDHLMEDHAVLSLDAAGDTLAQMIQQNEVIRAVEREGASAVLLSAGGNDLFQGGNIANLIETVSVGATAADLVGARFDAFLAKTLADYRALILRIRAAHPQVRIFIHGYSAAFSRMDRWIGRPLKDKGVMPVAVQNRVVEVMVERFNAAQKRLVADPAMGGRVFHVDLTALGKASGDWYDEIHMDGATNAKAAKAFAKALQAHLPALEGGLESGLPEPALARGADLPVTAVAAHARQLLSLDEWHLLAELDRRIALVGLDPAQGDLPSMELLTVSGGGLEGGLEGGLPAIGAVTRRLLRRWERELYDLLCGQDADDTADRAKLRDAAGLGPDALIGALAGWLVAGPLGVPALLAGVLAAILVKRFGTATLAEMCLIWKERLDAAQ